MIKIVKYANRKLYSPNFNKYLTLTEIVALVRANNSVEVLNHKTKENITKEVLKSAILEIDLNQDEILELLKK